MAWVAQVVWPSAYGFRALGLLGLGFRALGLLGLGFRALGLLGLGCGASTPKPECSKGSTLDPK